MAYTRLDVIVVCTLCILDVVHISVKHCELLTEKVLCKCMLLLLLFKSKVTSIHR